MELLVTLTPAHYLTIEEQKIRAKLIYGVLKSYKLKIIHDKNNSYDSLALKVICNGIFIGYIQKYDNPYDVNGFCFDNNQNIFEDLEIRYENYSFFLYRNDY